MKDEEKPALEQEENLLGQEICMCKGPRVGKQPGTIRSLGESHRAGMQWASVIKVKQGTSQVGPFGDGETSGFILNQYNEKQDEFTFLKVL